jgi:adenylate cyclase
MADIFVSYARADKARVAPLVAALEAEGWNVWWDPEITPGQEFDSQISAALDAARAVIVVWTPNSVDSRWVRGEAREAADRGVLVPVRFDNARLPIDARAMHTTDLDRWGESRDSAEFKNLARALSSLFGSGPRGSASGPSGNADDAVSIAVLPFVNMSADPEQEYFSDGLSEELINQLVKIKNLRVAGRTSCFAFKGKTDDLRLVGNKLGVNHVLEGSVRKAGQRLRITAQLIKCRDGFHLWSETYDRQLDDVFAIQDDVAQEVAKALGITLGMGETVRAPGGTTNIEAYDLYLRARALHASLGLTEIKRSLDVYRTALTLDPDFAMAWAGLGNAFSQSLIYYPETIEAVRPEMEHAFTRAYKLAPDVPEINASQAYQSLTHYDWAQAEKTLAIARGYTGDAIGIFGYLLTILGRAQDGVKHYEIARQADPLSMSVSFGMQFALDCAGRFEAAEAEYERSKDLAGQRVNVEWRGATRMWGRDDAKFKQRFAEALGSDTTFMPIHPQLLKVLDEPEAALKIIRRAFEDPFYQDGSRLGTIAIWAAHYGDADLVFKALRRGFVEMRGLTVIDIWNPVFAELRKDPRFKDIVRGVGLVDHWRASRNWGDFARPLGNDDFEIIR